MKTIEQILHTYHVTPLLVENITDRVIRIDDGKQLYALKRSDMTEQNVQMLEYTYKQANDKKLQFILPLYLTDTNQILTRVNGNYYYLTPWVSPHEPVLKHALHTIGTLHQKTSETYHLNSDSFKDSWKDYQVYCQTNAQRHLTYVEQFEKEHYMSPIGLQVCTHFRHLELTFKILEEQIGQLLEEVNTQTESTYCLCHGQLKPSLMLGEKDIIMLNWEKAELGHAAIDIASYLKQHIIDEEEPFDRYINAFDYYMKENKLTKQELRLLIIHLLDPTRYMSIIDEATNNHKDQSMIRQVQQLQQIYRQLLFGIKFTKSIQETFMLPDFGELDNDN